MVVVPALQRAASRARGQVRLIVDECGLDAVVVAERRFDDRKADVTPHQRRTVLIQRLSRSRHKTTTLEHDEETIAHKAPQPSIRRNRRREPRHEL